MRNVNPDYDYERQLGLAELKDNIAHAIEHLDGIVRVIIAIPRDKDAAPRSIKECFPAEKLVMKVIEFDRDVGTATLVRVDSE